MMLYPICRGALACLLLLAVNASARADDTATTVPTANEVVLQHVAELEEGGGYKWAGSGVPYDLKHQGQLVLAKSKTGTYCCGVTFAVAFRAAEQLGLLQDKTFAQVKQLQRDFYGAQEESAERLCVLGLERLEIGRAVSLDEAKTGDFAQFWRTKSGHSVVFLNWVYDGDRRIGLDYWSSQKSTDGIGTHREYFAGVNGHDGSVDPERIYIGRLGLETETEEAKTERQAR